jgi:hypothetical protein
MRAYIAKKELGKNTDRLLGTYLILMLQKNLM